MSGYAPEEITFWWVAILFGLGVIGVVILLLSVLVSMVKHIQRSVAEVRDTLRVIPENTANAELIPVTADRVDSVLAEGLEHHAFLTRVRADESRTPQQRQRPGANLVTMT